MSVRVDASEFSRAAGKLKAAPAKLKQQLSNRLRDAARPALREVLQEGAERMPSGGGLRDAILAQSSIELIPSSGSVGAVLQSKRVRLGRLNEGSLGHPLFGNRRYWYGQRVPAGTFTEALENRADEIGREVAKVFDDVTRSL